jgi:hypothetical protein
MTKPRAKIEDWRLGEGPGGTTVLYGLCTAHAGRSDLVGQRIHTSTLKLLSPKRGIAETLNTIYELGVEAEERPYIGTPDAS